MAPSGAGTERPSRPSGGPLPASPLVSRRAVLKQAGLVAAGSAWRRYSPGARPAPRPPGSSGPRLGVGPRARRQRARRLERSAHGTRGGHFAAPVGSPATKTAPPPPPASPPRTIRARPTSPCRRLPAAALGAGRIQPDGQRRPEPDDPHLALAGRDLRLDELRRAGARADAPGHGGRHGPLLPHQPGRPQPFDRLPRRADRLESRLSGGRARRDVQLRLDGALTRRLHVPLRRGPVIMHIGDGMYGMVIVDPRPAGPPPASTSSCRASSTAPAARSPRC